jgi:hypothetical protein
MQLLCSLSSEGRRWPHLLGLQGSRTTVWTWPLLAALLHVAPPLELGSDMNVKGVSLGG